MEVLVLDGKNFVKASKAAKELGYATDYVGQLCRSGQVAAHLVGRTWYVDQAELGTHRIEKKRMSRIKAREHAKRSIEEHRQKAAVKQTDGRRIAIQYESDTEDLIPTTRKISVQSSIPERHISTDGIDDFPNETQVENKGEKVLMSGSIPVVDVTDELMDPETIILKPSHIRGSLHRILNVPPVDAHEEAEAEIVIQKSDTEVVEKKLTFAERLVEEEVALITPDEVIDDSEYEAQETTDTTPEETKSPIAPPSVLPYLIVLLFLTLGVFATLTVTTHMIFAPNETIEFSQSFSFRIADLISILQFKI